MEQWFQSLTDPPWLRRLRQSIQISQGFDAIPTTKHPPDSSSSSFQVHHVHHSHHYTSSIPSTFDCADNASFTRLLSPAVLSSPKRSALFLPWSNWVSEVTWLPNNSLAQLVLKFRRIYLYFKTKHLNLHILLKIF